MAHRPLIRQPMPSAGRQQGAALLAAMVIVTIVVTIASSMVWQQWRAVQVETAERGVAQSQWILRGALNWGRLILRADSRTIDHLGEPWAVPLAEARISSFLSADQQDNVDAGPEAFLSGQIYDVGARFNLAGLVDASGAIDPSQLQVLRELCGYLSMSTGVADQIADAYSRAWMATASDDPQILTRLGGEEGRQKAPVMPQTVEQLIWFGVDAGVAERLRPYVSLIVGQQVPVNLNTAPREVLAAVLDIDLGRADRLVQARQRSPFTDPGDIPKVLGNVPVPSGNVAVTSNFFEVTGRLRLEDSVMQKRYLVQRNGPDVRVLFETTVAGRDIQGQP